MTSHFGGHIRTSCRTFDWMQHPFEIVGGFVIFVNRKGGASVYAGGNSGSQDKKNARMNLTGSASCPFSLSLSKLGAQKSEISLAWNYSALTNSCATPHTTSLSCRPCPSTAAGVSSLPIAERCSSVAPRSAEGIDEHQLIDDFPYRRHTPFTKGLHFASLQCGYELTSYNRMRASFGFCTAHVWQCKVKRQQHFHINVHTLLQSITYYYYNCGIILII